ncbi:MAG TPA: CbiM family transporter [Gemmataceae bacterium]|nr:CbiM family transporter [Gemmataceae bacterium]
MSLALLPSLFAVHISDGVLQSTWLAGGFIISGLFALYGAWRIRDEEIPQIALLTAAFFVASSIHIKMGPSSWHLLFNGLVGVILGRRAALAIPIGLTLQAVLLQHGGFTAIGVNTCIMLLPALAASVAFSAMRRATWLRRRSLTILEIMAGFVVGTLAVLATIALNYVALVFGSEMDLTVPARLLVLFYLPVAALEGVIVGFLVGFLVKVKPTMIGWGTSNEVFHGETTLGHDSHGISAGGNATVGPGASVERHLQGVAEQSRQD